MVQAGVPALADSACGARPGRSAVAAAAMLFGVTAVAPRWIMPHLAARVVPLLEERGSQTHTACEPWPLRARDR